MILIRSNNRDHSINDPNFGGNSYTSVRDIYHHNQNN